MQITLYYAPFTCALIPFVLLEEAGAEFSVETVNMFKGGHMRPEFLRVNPRHKVPVLVRDGKILTETVAMQLWIARTFPEARLLPDDPEEQVQAVSLMAWCAANIHTALTPFTLPERYCDLPDSKESVQRCAGKLLDEAFGLMDERLAGREWFFERFSSADVHFFWTFRRATLFSVDVARYANCQAHFARMNARPSVRKVVEFEAQTLARFKAAG
jgi:glutathione S-transferase